MKICLINNLYKPYNRGGAEKVTEIIASGLMKAGHEVFVITTKPKKELRLRPELRPRGVAPSSRAQAEGSCAFVPSSGRGESRVYYLNSLYFNLNKLPKFLRLFWQIWNAVNFINYFKIKKILHKEKCQAVITNNLMGVGFLTAPAIRHCNIKHLHIVHDIQLIHPSGLMYYGKENAVNNFFAKIYAGFCRVLFNSPLAVIFPSRWLRDLYAKRNFFARSKIIVWQNPVENAPEQAREPFDNFTFLFLGQIEKHKGIFLLIDAFNRFNLKFPEVKLLIAGDGSKIKAARKKAAGNANIKFIGWPGDDEADKLLFRSHCLIYPSLVYENCPNAIQRALIAGLPVIASGLGGIPELINKKTGILFSPAEVNDLAEKMELMIENRRNFQVLSQIDFKAESYIKKIEEAIG